MDTQLYRITHLDGRYRLCENLTMPALPHVWAFRQSARDDEQATTAIQIMQCRAGNTSNTTPELVAVTPDATFYIVSP